MRVGILYDAGGADWSAQDVAAVLANVREVRAVLRRRAHSVTLHPVRLGDLDWLGRVRRADLIFNLCEGVGGEARYEDYVLGALELTGVPFTGCRAWPVTICHRKSVANTLLAAAGVPIPRFMLLTENRVPSDFPLPAIVKPDGEDASVGIDGGAVCASRKALKQRLAESLERFDDVMVQEYIAGREFNVGFVGKQALPVSEISFQQMPADRWPIVTYDAKWSPGSADDLGTQPVCPGRISPSLARRLTDVARLAWEHLSRGEGYGRVDLRLNDAGEPFVLEVNPDPDLSSDAGLARMGRAFGWEYDELVMRIVDETLGRAQRTRAAADLAEAVPA